MAGPLSGLGQQIPLATTFQPGGANNNGQQVRPTNEQSTPANNEIRAQGAPTNETQQSSNRNASQRETFQTADSSVSNDSDQRRGSIVNIQV